MSDQLSALFAASSGNVGTDAHGFDELFDLPTVETLPKGWYPCEIVSGKVGESKSGKARYELRARVVDGEHTGRPIIDDFYLSSSAWWKSGPLLKKLGIDGPDKLKREYPTGILARIRVTVGEFNGAAKNTITDVQIVGRKPPEELTPAPTPTVDPFAPTTATESAPKSEGESKGDAWEHPADRRLPADALSFSFGATANGPGSERR